MREPMDDLHAELFTLFRSPSRARCAEYALVLQAVGIHCRVEPLEDGFALKVRARDAGHARRQIELYAAENPERDRPPRFDPRHRVADGLNCASLYGVTILLLDLAQRHRAFGLDWWEAGYSQAGLIRAGEWWRAFTALGLHADPLHLAGNLLYGLVFGFLAGQQLGWGFAWSGLLLAGALGNGLNAFIQSPAHSSVGASTAVFATLGMLAVANWIRRAPGLGRWVPLGAGLALLAFLGMGGQNTDIFAHVAGFLAGCLTGGLFGLAERRVAIKARHQTAERLVHALEHANIVIYYDKPGDAVLQTLDSWTGLYGGQWSGIVVTYRGRGPEKPVR